MIGFLRGTLESKRPQIILVDVNGVGYQLTVPLSTYEQLPEVGSDIKVFTHLRVREIALDLYGFLSVEERTLFEHLLTVADVGPKTAITILSGMRPMEIRAAIISKNAEALRGIPGVGKKTAERLVVELKDKLGVLEEAAMASSRMDGRVMEDATAALVALGYTMGVVRQAVRKAAGELPDRATVQDVIKASLRQLS